MVNANDPVIDFDGNGNIFFSYLSRNNSQIYITRSSDLGLSWSSDHQVSSANYIADKEWLTIDRSSNHIYMVWMEFGSLTELKFAKSTDNGNSFAVNTVESTPSGSGSFSPFIATGNNGLVYITYSVIHNLNKSNENFDLRFAKSTDYGANFIITDIDANLTPPGYFRGEVDEAFVLKYDETNEARSFRIYPVPSMVINKQNGHIYIVLNYKEEKNSSPVISQTDYSDLILYRSTNNGANWTQHRIFDWEENEVDIYQNDGDQFFPSITCSEDGKIYCLFYNSLSDYYNLNTKMSIAYSTDNAESFGIIDTDNNEFDPSIGASSNFAGDYIQIKNDSEKLSFAYTKRHQVDPYHILYYHSKNLSNDITVYNNVNNNNTLGNIYVDETQYTSLPRILPLSLNDHSLESPNLVNNWKFYKWQSALDPSIDGSRIKKEYFIADINKTINSKFEQTTSLAVCNYFEGGNGGAILFGEKYFDVENRNSPYTENAFLYNPPTVQSIYRAEANQTHNLFNTTWNFWKWDNGLTTLWREEQITQTTPIGWKAIYKGHFRSDYQNGISSNSQRKMVRTDNGIYHLVYESMGNVYYTHSLTSNFDGAWAAEEILWLNSKNPAIEYNDNTVKIVFELYDPTFSSNAVIYLATYIPDVNGQYTSVPNECEVVAYFPSTYFGNAKPVISYNSGGVAFVYRKNSTEGLKVRTKWLLNGVWSWQAESTIPQTDANSINPSIIGETGIIHIAYESQSTIKYKLALNQGQNWLYNNVITLSTGSGYTTNTYPSISLCGYRSPYVMVSWRGTYTSAIEKRIAKENDESDHIETAVAKVGYGTSWGGFSSFSNNVNFTNNNSLNTSLGSILTWSESNGQVSKFVRRKANGTYDALATLSTNGIQTMVSNGSAFDNMKAMVFNAQPPAPYLLNKCDNSFPLNKIGGSKTVDISYGRSGVVEKNGLEFLFSIGDVLLDGQTINFVERVDTLPVVSIDEMNLVERTNTFNLGSESELIFSDYYYVVNKNLASSLSDEFNVTFKCELVNATTDQVVGTFDNVIYNKLNVQEYANSGYLIDCSGIDAGNYYLKLTTAVNDSVNLFLSDIQRANVSLDKSNLLVRNFKGEGVPVEYDLAQNYPNPFNPSTTIRYQIPQDGIVTLKIYDILGNEVTTLINEHKQQGRYEVNFNASQLASGVYLYKLQAGDFISSKKMLLIK